MKINAFFASVLCVLYLSFLPVNSVDAAKKNLSDYLLRDNTSQKKFPPQEKSKLDLILEKIEKIEQEVNGIKSYLKCKDSGLKHPSLCVL